MLTICESYMAVPFKPEKLLLDPDTGLVYHPALRTADGVGIVSRNLSSMWKTGNRFVFEDGDSKPATHFLWREEKLALTNELIPALDRIHLRRKRMRL